MSITRTFDLIINAGTSSPLVINANQNDSGETWLFNLYQEDGTKVTPTAGEIVGLKADNHAIVNAGTVNASGQVVITETAQMTAAPGTNVFEIVFDSVHGTANFILLVERAPVDDDADFSESDISAIEEAIAMSANTRMIPEIVRQQTLMQAEIDEIIAPSGEAPSAAEVQNARIGADGTVYDTLGNAIRGQVSDLNQALNAAQDDIISIAEGTDLSGSAVDGRWYSGGIGDTASYVDGKTGSKSLLISVAQNEQFILLGKGATQGRSWYYLDSNNKILDRGNLTVETEKTIPSGVSYLIIQTNDLSIFKAVKITDTSLLTVNKRLDGVDNSIQEVQSDVGQLEADIYLIQEGTDYSGNAVDGRWYSGTTIGNVITESTSVSGTKSVLLTVSENQKYKVLGKGGSSGKAVYYLDNDMKIKDRFNLSPLTDTIITIPSGATKLVVQTNDNNYFKAVKISDTSLEMTNIKLNNLISVVENEVIQQPVYRTSDTKYGNAALSKLKVNDTGVVNIGFIGDSWTQGVDSETYVKWLSKKLWEKYGFGGLGWFDFARDRGTLGYGTIFGCSDLYEHFEYSFAGTVTGYDGSYSSDAANCLGICCAHSIFANEASLTITFDSGYIDKFKIAYYKDAHFTVSINDGSSVEITANSSDGWQMTELGVTGTDTTKIVITSLADDTVIFGMDCSYGTKGVKCHKIGNRSISLAKYLLMDEDQFVEGVASLNLSWVSLLFAINDIGASTTDSACEEIINNFTSFIQWIESACTRDNMMTCDISLLGCANIASSASPGLPLLEKYEREYAINNKYGWVSTRECIGSDSTELAETGLFLSDNIHMNKTGSRIYGEYIFKWLFDSISVI